ncbi:MAG: ATP-dependent RecD-like DNA helicase, partial [Oscillospiraceae bacterium]|nr:ATP-dependent RecD-like DNA helicase [Oscillospiraceae bacterium]
MDQDSMLTELSGTVDSVIYKNEENGYTVLRLRDGNGETVTVVGCFPYAAQGETMLLSGAWTTHSVHGRQFKAEFAQRLMPTDTPAIYEYLAGGSVKGVGPATASLIVNRFGAKSLDVIENEPEKLAEIRGISPIKAKQISASFRQQAGMRRLMEYICSFGLRPLLAMRLYKYYGDEAMSLLQANPFILASEHIGGSFSEADHLAMATGMDEHSRSRINAAVIFELNHNAGNGHVFIPRDKLAAATGQLIGVSAEEADESIAMLADAGLLILDEIANVTACYLPELYSAETDAAAKLAHMARTRFREQADPERLIARLEKQQGILYADKQKQTLQMALNNQILVITGGPGTGKTTSIRAILAL